MRSVIQRVTSCFVTIDGSVTSKIDQGLLVLLGIQHSDTEKEVNWMADKISNLRIFNDDQGKMNKSLLETAGEVLIVSQFTLYGDCRKGRRPGYSNAAPPELAKPLYELFITKMKELNITTKTGRFGADMQVTLVNDGPVTLLLDSDKHF